MLEKKALLLYAWEDDNDDPEIDFALYSWCNYYYKKCYRRPSFSQYRRPTIATATISIKTTIPAFYDGNTSSHIGHIGRETGVDMTMVAVFTPMYGTVLRNLYLVTSIKGSGSVDAGTFIKSRG
jgi:hypothetical protein